MKKQVNVLEATIETEDDKRIKELTDELCSLDCKSSGYRLRSEQILFEIKIIKKQKSLTKNKQK